VSRSGQARTARRFLIWNPENKQNCMCRQAALSKPPGDFWNFPEIQNSRYLATRNNAQSFHTSIINQLQISYEFSTHNLVSLLKSWNLFKSLCTKNPALDSFQLAYNLLKLFSNSLSISTFWCSRVMSP